MTAAGLPVLLGFIALAVDRGILYTARKNSRTLKTVAKSSKLHKQRLIFRFAYGLLSFFRRSQPFRDSPIMPEFAEKSCSFRK